MAFTHTHINAYVIVGGDSDFITLVEKLKQYDKQIFVVGGRAFTSVVMQRNCHEFIAYENLVSSRRSADRGRQPGPAGAQSPIDQVVPLVRRALKVLSDREVSPQLGLLKSTLLQLDSTFSERTYGVGSFRDFAQKLATAGHVRLREHGRNVLVELAEGEGQLRSEDTTPSVHTTAPEPRDSQPRESPPRELQPREPPRRDLPQGNEPQHVDLNPPPGGEPRAADGIRAVRRIFQAAPNPPRFPMYVRQAKQFMRGVDPQFDERKYGFGTLQDLLRACQRDGLFRIERDRQGVIRLFPGNIMQPATGADDPEDDDLQPETQAGSMAESGEGWSRERDVAVAAEPPAAPGDDQRAVDVNAEPEGADIVEGDVVRELDVQQVIDGEEAPAVSEQPRRGRGTRKRATAQPKAAKKSEAAAPRARKAAPRSRAPRARKTPSE
jgi:hypothetical protein